MTTATTVLLWAASSTAKKSGSYSFLIIVVIAYAAIYFLWLRPRQKRARAAKVENKAYEVGDTVQTVGGMIATISSMDDRTVTLRTESGQEMKFLRQAIHQKFVEPSDADEPDGASGDGSEGEGH